MRKVSKIKIINSTCFRAPGASHIPVQCMQKMLTQYTQSCDTQINHNNQIQDNLPGICEAAVAQRRVKGRREGQEARPQGNGSAHMLAAVCWVDVREMIKPTQ